MQTKSVNKTLSWGKWQVVIGISSLVIMIAFGTIAYLQAFESKRMKVVVLADQSIINIAEGFERQISVTYSGRVVDNLSTVRVRIENAGNRAIIPEEIVEPIVFSFPEPTTVVTATVAEVNPSSFNPDIVIADNTVTIANTLWNGGKFYGIGGDRAILDFVILDASETESGQTFSISARIKDIGKIEVINAIDDEEGSLVAMIVTIVAITISSILTLLNLLSWRETRRREMQSMAMVEAETAELEAHISQVESDLSESNALLDRLGAYVEEKTNILTILEDIQNRLSSEVSDLDDQIDEEEA